MTFIKTYFIKKFVKELVPSEELYLDSFAKIIIAYLQAKRLRISDIANSIGSISRKKGNNADKIDETNYKAIQRFLKTYLKGSYLQKLNLLSLIPQRYLEKMLRKQNM